jgi:membrane protease YdiL (CAAX protease family)
MAVLITLILSPLVVIGLQLLFDLDANLGGVGHSLYKICFFAAPLLYCKWHRIGVIDEILKPRHWRRCLPAAFGLGTLALLIFWTVYATLGETLLDEAMIVEKIGNQFSVTPRTVFLIAPVTIFVNSLLEEFFYRGFAFGQLVQRQRLLGMLLPAFVFTTQHVLFIYHWMTPLPLAIAVVGLFVFAMVLQKLYKAADSIVAPWLAHALGDVAMMSIAVTILWR